MNGEGVGGSNLIVLKDFFRFVLFTQYSVNLIVHRGSVWEAEFIFPAVLEHRSVEI